MAHLGSFCVGLTKLRSQFNEPVCPSGIIKIAASFVCKSQLLLVFVYADDGGLATLEILLTTHRKTL